MERLDHVAEAVRWLQARVTGDLQTDSRRVRPGDAFIAWPGAATDGRLHVAAARQRGAVACLVEQAGCERFGFEGPGVAAYPGLKADTGAIASAYYGEPSRALDIVAVTGTNGKTSTSWWIAQALTALPGGGRPCGLVGTLGVGRPPDVVSTGLTTPDPVLLQRALRRFVDEGDVACAMEASSIGLAEQRLAGTRVRVAVYTNFTQDHLDYHGSMPAYWAAKRALFDWPGLRAAVLNTDDPKGAALAAELAGRDLDLWTCGVDSMARLRAVALGITPDGLAFTVVEGDTRARLQTRQIGRYNVDNLLAVLGTLRALGVGLAEAVEACAHLSPVPGRMERLAARGAPEVVVDYAHTPDALDKALAALRPLSRQRGGRLWCVFGCGGDRDSDKRPLMAAAAEAQADRLVITSDNPRTEDPAFIARQMLAGLQRPQEADLELDRARAIVAAVEGAAAQDVILLAGKGHEDYQDVAGVRTPFSDVEQARAALARRVARQTEGRGG